MINHPLSNCRYCGGFGTKSQFLSFSAHFRETGGNRMIRLVLRHGNLEIILPVGPSLTLLEGHSWIACGRGAISLRGKVGESEPPYLVLPLTVEPTKPRLCHDARFLNLWMVDMPFSLDSLTHLPRYVGRDTYQTVLDDKSGYDHFLLTEDSREFFGIQWGGWNFVYNTLPFGWKISPYVYHSTGLLASNFFRSIGIPCSLYIDDRHA